MKRIVILVYVIVFSCINVLGQTKLPEQCVAFYPEVLQSSAVIKQSTVDKFLKNQSLGQKKSTRDKKFWIVFSDRDNNVTYTTPGGSVRHSVLDLNDKLRIAQISGGYALVYVEPLEDIAYPRISQYAECKGWISVNNLLLWHSCPANEAGIYNKALLCVNLDKQSDETLGKVFHNPHNLSIYDRLETNMHFYYVMKREGNLSLLASTHTLDGTSEDVLLGWVAEQSYVAWNQRSCIEPTWDKQDVEYFAANNVRAEVFKETDLRQRATSITFKRKSGGADDKYLYRMHPDFVRFPLLDNGTATLYNCSAFVTAGGKTYTISNLDDGALSESEAKLHELTKINIGLVIDGTKSMGEFYDPVLSAIKEGTLFFENKYKVQVGAVIYRDYADGEYVTEVQKLTHPDNPSLSEFLMDGGEYGIKSHRSDRTLAEAMYQGIDVALDRLGFKNGQTNILLVVGDCGNDRNDNRITSDEIVAKLVEKNVHIMGFQVNRKTNDAYELFSSQLVDLMRESLQQKYTRLNEGVNVVLRETMDGYELVNNVSSNIYVGTHNYPELGSKLPYVKLSEMIQDAIRTCAESAKQRIDVLASFNTGGFKANSNAVNTDIDIDDEWLRYVLGEKYQMIKNANSLLSFQGYVRKTDPSGRNYFKPVVFISSDELSSLIDRLAPVNEAAVAQSNDREPYINALKALVQTMVPEYTDEVMSEMSYKKLMAKITGLNESADALKGYTLQEIASHRAVSHAEYAKLVDNFKRKFEGLRRLKSQPYKYTRTFNGLRYYWLPVEDLP